MFLCLRNETRSRAHDGTDLVALGEGLSHQVLEGTGVALTTAGIHAMERLKSEDSAQIYPALLGR